METADESPTTTGPVHVYRSQNEDQGDSEDQDQSTQSDQSHDFDTGDDEEKFNELESEDGSGGSEDVGKRADHCRLKKCKVSGMRHGAKGKGSTAKDMDEHPDERVNGCKPGKQVGPKQCKVNGKKSAKGPGARGQGQGTKGKGTKGKVVPPTHHSTHKQ